MVLIEKDIRKVCVKVKSSIREKSWSKLEPNISHATGMAFNKCASAALQIRPIWTHTHDQTSDSLIK
jgi:hypothetical protein